MIQSLLIIKEAIQMSTKEQLSKLPEDTLKKEVLKIILRITLLRLNLSSMLKTKQLKLNLFY
jgi:hypothetical protein